MSYYIATYEDDSWKLGNEISRIQDAIPRYETRAHLYGDENVKLLMERSVNIQTNATLVYLLDNEKYQLCIDDKTEKDNKQ